MKRRFISPTSRVIFFHIRQHKSLSNIPFDITQQYALLVCNRGVYFYFCRCNKKKFRTSFEARNSINIEFTIMRVYLFSIFVHLFFQGSKNVNVSKGCFLQSLIDFLYSGCLVVAFLFIFWLFRLPCASMRNDNFLVFF